jgi:hypothetical protein
LLRCRRQETRKREQSWFDYIQGTKEETLPREVLYNGEEGEGDLHISGKDISSPLWKTEFWKMEAGRTDHCGK